MNKRKIEAVSVSEENWLPPRKSVMNQGWKDLIEKLNDSIPEGNLIIFMPFMFVDVHMAGAFDFQPFTEQDYYIANNYRRQADTWEYNTDIALCHTSSSEAGGGDKSKRDPTDGVMPWPRESTNPKIYSHTAYFNLMPKAGFTFVIASHGTMTQLFDRGFKADVVVFFFNEVTRFSNYFFTEHEIECYEKFQHPHVVTAMGLYKREWDERTTLEFYKRLLDKVPEHKLAKARLINYLRHIPDYQDKVAPHDLYSYLFSLKFPDQ